MGRRGGGVGGGDVVFGMGSTVTAESTLPLAGWTVCRDLVGVTVLLSGVMDTLPLPL